MVIAESIERWHEQSIKNYEELSRSLNLHGNYPVEWDGFPAYDFLLSGAMASDLEIGFRLPGIVKKEVSDRVMKTRWYKARYTVF